jgi:hypothetical protein
LSDNQESAVLSELTQAVVSKEETRMGFANHIGDTFTAEQAADAAIQAFTDHMYDPRTVERACINYFSSTGTDWAQLPDGSKEMWRNNVQTILKSALE